MIDDHYRILTPSNVQHKVLSASHPDGNRSFRQRVSSPTTSSVILKSIRQRQNTVWKWSLANWHVGETTVIHTSCTLDNSIKHLLRMTNWKKKSLVKLLQGVVKLSKIHNANKSRAYCSIWSKRWLRVFATLRWMLYWSITGLCPVESHE